MARTSFALEGRAASLLVLAVTDRRRLDSQQCLRGSIDSCLALGLWAQCQVLDQPMSSHPIRGHSFTLAPAPFHAFW